MEKCVLTETRLQIKYKSIDLEKYIFMNHHVFQNTFFLNSN